MARVLMLDVDGVIVHPKDGRHWSTNLQRDLGIDPIALQTHFFAAHWEQIVTGQLDLYECISNVLASIASDITPERLVSYWFEHDGALDERVLNSLVIIRASAIKVYLTTNQEHIRMHHLMDVGGLRRYVDGCYYSAAVGCRKPRRAFFDAVLPSFTCASELLLVDDSPDNIAAALAAGWSAEHWEPHMDLHEIVRRRITSPR